jgi:hypothetical protein
MTHPKEIDPRSHDAAGAKFAELAALMPPRVIRARTWNLNIECHSEAPEFSSCGFRR